MTEEKTMGRAARRWPDTDAEGVSAKTSAVAGLSLGVVLLALESERLAALTRVGGATGTPSSAHVVALLVLSVCTALLCLRPARRPAPPSCALMAALACSVGLAQTYYLGDASSAALRFAGTLLYSVSGPALLYLWVQRVVPFGRAFAMQSFGMGAIALGCLSMLTVVLEHAVAVAFVVALPLVGAVLMAMVDSGEALRLRGDQPQDCRAAGDAGLSTGFGPGRWNALRAVAEGAYPAFAGRMGAGRVLGGAFLKLVPFLCYAVVFGNVHFSWVGLQDGGPVSVWVQLGASTGSMVCGFAALGLARLHWGRAFENMMHLLLAAFALVALWLSTFLTIGYVFAYLVLLNIAQKLMLMLIVLFGFSHARDERACTSLWVLAYYSFYLGTCVSYQVGCWGTVDVLNLVAAVALGVVFVADIVDIAALYGVRPDGGDRGAQGCSQAATVADAAASPPGTEGRGAGGVHADETAEMAGSAAEAPTPVGAAFDVLPYRCHLIADEYDLTRREEEILQLLVRGRTAARIAETLCITTATTRTHLRNIYAKLGVHSQQDILDLFEEYSARGV